MMFFILHYLGIGTIFGFMGAVIEQMSGGTKANAIKVYIGGVIGWPIYIWLYCVVVSSKFREVNK